MWLLPSDNLIQPKSTVAEIDAVELYGHDPRGACHTTHSYTDGRDVQGIALCGRRFATDQDAMRWHVYGVTVEPTQIVYWIDGKVVARAPQVNGGDKPMFLLIDLALGGGWPIALDPVQNRAAMYVDWFRVYV
jgi:beta-glucanase (GH16 family)